jgi:DivIVA domain-containing protein
METKSPPSFTVSLRGYDREEVDHYLDSLAEALHNVEDAEDRNHRLQVHVSRLNARIKDLEDRIQADTPKTGAVLGERIAILLSAAEETAAETITRAEVKAAETVGVADERLSNAQDEVRSVVAKAQEDGRRIEADARSGAAAIVAESESRAAARTRQIEQWAEDVVAKTRAEDERMHREQQLKREAAAAEVAALMAQRDRVAQALSDLRDSLGHAIGEVNESAEADPAPLAPSVPEGEALAEVYEGAREPDLAAGEAEAIVALDDAHESAASSAEDSSTDQPASVASDSSLSNGSGSTGPGTFGLATTTGWHPAVVFDDIGLPSEHDPSEAEPFTDPTPAHGTGEVGEDFEVKLEAWVSEGARHFRQD